jgi:hypothetical protein
MRRVAVVGAVCLTIAATAVRAQTLPDEGAKAAREAQVRFELYRRSHLPETARGEPPCDARVGRFCYWDSNDEPSAPAEPEAIARGRERLIEALRAQAAMAPGDGWTAGQLVRYLVEAGRAGEAVRAARACGGTTWWCAAVRGYALHTADDDSASAAAFDEALAAMPEKERCEWTDLTTWLDGDVVDRYKGLDCAARERMARRVFWLARPLLATRAGDEARAEFLSRRTVAALFKASISPHGLSWGDDVEEVGLRYGWPSAWSRHERRIGALEDATPGVVGYEPRPAHAFLPVGRVVADPLRAAPGDWSLEDRIAQARYAPAYADTFATLTHQLARFRRGDSLVVVASYDGGDAARWGDGPLRAALLLAGSPDSVMARAANDAAAARGALRVTAPNAPALVAVELFAPKGRRAARARYGVAPLDPRSAVSDLLLVDASKFDGDAANADLADVLPDALATTAVPAGGSVGLFWESYVPPEEDKPIRVSLTLVPTTMSLARRMAVALHLADRPAPVTLKWDDSGRPDGPAGHVLVLHTDGMPEGRYRLELALRRDEAELGVARGEVTVKGR